MAAAAVTNAQQIKEGLLEIIQHFRVPDLHALLDYARRPRSGNKRDLLQRCQILLSTPASPQLVNKINQINIARLNQIRNQHSSPRNFPPVQHAIISSPTPPVDNLPLPNQIQYVHLPFFERQRNIECINMSVDWKHFPPLRFLLTDYDIDQLSKGQAKVLLRIAPTITSERHNDVLPPYLYVQCNSQAVINNTASKTVGSPAHSISFPTDITDKLILRSNIHNTINYTYQQSPVSMSFKNLPKSYTLMVQIVRCISLDTLCDRILNRELQVTKSNNGDSDIEIEDIGLVTTQHRVSLICPITQSLIINPTKSSYCSHLTCFDLRSFLQMNERRLEWKCPLCKKPASYETLHVDKRLQSIIKNVPPNCSTVEIDSSSKVLTDCQYILDNVKQEKNDAADAATTQINDDDDDEDHDKVGVEEESINNSTNKSRQHSSADDCIVLSSGEESEGEDEDDNTQNNYSSVPITPLSNDLCNTDERPTNPTSQSPNSTQLLQSIMRPLVDDDDGSYWEDIARITHDLMSDNNTPPNEQNFTRKRSNSSNSSLLSNNDDHHQHRKRAKHSSDIEVITLSSNDSSDNEDQLL